MRPSLTLTGPDPRTGGPDTPTLPRVTAWLTPRERRRVEAAVGGHVGITFHDTLGTVADDLARDGADAVLLSAALIGDAEAGVVARYVRRFPAVTFAGLVSEAVNDAEAVLAAHRLGRAGAHALVDCRTPTGWAALRRTLAPRHLTDAFQRECVREVLAAVYGGVHVHRQSEAARHVTGLARFFSLAFTPDVRRVRDLAARLAICPQTLTSRFFRAGLPSPKQYLTWARLVWAARLAEAPGLSISAIAERLDASSLQAFGRSMRLHVGLSPTEFRRRFTGPTMLARYCAVLIAPHQEQLRTFDPLGEHRTAEATESRRPRWDVSVTQRAA